MRRIKKWWLFFDNDEKKWGNIVEGIRVYPPSDIALVNPDVIIVASSVGEDEIIHQLKVMGYVDNVINLETLEILVWGKEVFKLFYKFFLEEEIERTMRRIIKECKR